MAKKNPLVNEIVIRSKYMEDNESEYITSREAAEYLNINSRVLLYWVLKGKLVAYKFSTNKLREYKRDDIEKLRIFRYKDEVEALKKKRQEVKERRYHANRSQDPLE
jgi:excisionase family DNA binding protein